MAELKIMNDVLMTMNRTMTASLAIVRGSDKKTTCSLCGEETDSNEIKEGNGYCKFCNLQSEVKYE